MNKRYYSYKQCVSDCKVLLSQIKTYAPDALVCVASGGLIVGHLLSEALNTRDIYTINSIHYEDDKKLNTFDVFNIPDLCNFKKVVLVDDIVDSGETMVQIIRILTHKYPECEFKIASLFYKQTALIKADFTAQEAKNWIEFFWEVDLKK